MSELKQVLDEIEVKVTALMKYVVSLEKQESDAVRKDRERIIIQANYIFCDMCTMSGKWEEFLKVVNDE